MDPPLPLDPVLGVAAQGVKLIERAGVWHVVDWVGSVHYKNVADFVEECVAPHEPVITMRGLVPICEVVVGDEVLTHRGRWRPVTDTMRRRYTGSLIRLTTQGTYVPLEVTPGHPVAVRVGGGIVFKAASAVQRGDWLAFPVESHECSTDTVNATYEIEWARDRRMLLTEEDESEIRQRYGAVARYKHGDESYRSIGERYGVSPSVVYRVIRHSRRRTRGRLLPVNAALMRLVGWYLAEGSPVATRGPGKGWYVTQFSLGSSEGSAAEEIVCAARALGFSANARPHQGQLRVDVHSRPLAEWLVRDFGHGAHEKQVAAWVFGLPERLIRVLLRCYLHGDGSCGAGGRWSASTVSERLAVDLRRLALLCGSVVSVRHGRSSGFGSGEIIRIDLGPGGRSGMELAGKLARSESHMFMRVRSVLEVPYDGEVCNLAVEDDESYSLRYHVVHNCRRFGLSRKLPRTTEFAKLGPQSRILLVHSRAVIGNVNGYRSPTGGPYPCPQGKAEHTAGGTMCAGIWWEDLEQGAHGQSPFVPQMPDWLSQCPPSRGGVVRRAMPSFQYDGFEAPRAVLPQYHPGFIASFPISRLVVVQDQAEGTHEQTLERVRQSTLPIDLVD